jgi:PEP-CTERM motif
MDRLRFCAAALALGIVALVVAAPASAAVVTPPTVSFSMSRSDGVNPTVHWSTNTLGEGNGPEYSYINNVANANWNFAWNVTVDPDPIITSSLVVTNNTALIQTFTSTVALPISPIAATLRGGSVGGSVTDVNSNGATLSTVLGSALYTAQVNGIGAHTLHPHAYIVTVNPSSTANVTAIDFGSPIPSLLSGPATGTIGIQLHFTLTPGDTAVLSSSFVVDPVPEPASLAAIGLAGAALLLRRRRS